MPLNQPVMYFEELTDDRLKKLAEQLLDIRYSTIRSMNSEYDDNYTRETAVFGRTRQLLISLATSKKYDWLELKSPGMDVTVSIGRVPVRYFCDDYESPAKGGFFKRNDVDQLFAPEDQLPVLWRIVVQKALTDEDEDHVVFAGYNVFQEKVSEWIYRPSAPTLHVVGQDTPPSKPLGSAPVDVREPHIKKSYQPPKIGNA
jgi:hypothetical protein